MKRRARKRKSKPKQNLNAEEPPSIQAVTFEPPAPSIETPIETENSATYVELQDELVTPESILEERAEPEAHPTSTEVSSTAEKPRTLPAPTAADRRTHPRYAFAASAEVVAIDSGVRIETHVRDLSEQGCYLDTESPLPLGTTASVRIAKGKKSFEASARVVFNQPGKGMGLMFTGAEPESFLTLSMWIAESRETSWLAANRRRSQRVLMKIPVRVSGQTPSAEPSEEEETYTLAVSAHGALLAFSAPVYRGQRLTLSNPQTKAELECVVVHIDKLDQEIHVGVEFLLPNPTFWRVAFPPKDWTPSHPDAKAR